MFLWRPRNQLLEKQPYFSSQSSREVKLSKTICLENETPEETLLDDWKSTMRKSYKSLLFRVRQTFDISKLFKKEIQKIFVLTRIKIRPKYTSLLCFAKNARKTKKTFSGKTIWHEGLLWTQRSVLKTPLKLVFDQTSKKTICL